MSWLIPLALMGLVVVAVRRPVDRTERTGWLLWGLVFATHFVVFSLMSGVFHPYYSMTIAPAIAALAGAGMAGAWRSWRGADPGWWLLPIGIAATAVCSAALLGRTPGFYDWLAPAIVATAAVVTGRHGLGQIPTQPTRGLGDAGRGARRLRLSRRTLRLCDGLDRAGLLGW